MEFAPLGPGDLQGVFDCLRGCLSQDVQVQKQAEAALTSLGIRPGFCSCLAEIILSKEADHSARWLAAVHFKNSIAKFWRSRAPGAITEDEKNHLRPKLLELLDQEDSQIAVQTAVVLAKVARLDFPKSWPSLFNDLLGRLQNASNTLTARRCYLALHHTLKELATKRLAADQRTFESITQQLLEPLWTQWGLDTGVLLSELPAALASGAASQQAILVVFERWLLQLKAIRRMLLFGFPSDSRTIEPVPAVEKSAPVMLNTLKSLLQLMPEGAGAIRSQSAMMLARGCLKLIKTLRQLSEVHPWSVIRYGALAECMELCCTQIATPRIQVGQSASAFSRQCLQFLHSVLRCAAYRGSPAALSLSAGKGREQMDKLKAMSAEAAPILRNFWSTRQQPLVELIITRFFPLTDAELELWEDSGEEFHQEMEHTAWEESTRGCAERVYVALLEQDREQLAPYVMSLLQQSISSQQNGIIIESIRAKAAVYHAITAGAYELYDNIDFSSWLHASLLNEGMDNSVPMKSIRRASIKLIAAWASKLKKEDRPLIYRMLIQGLGDQDPAIHLAAAAALHALVDDWEFDEAQFAEFVPSCFQLLTTLLTEVGELEAQMEIFALINLIIDRLGDGAALYAQGLLSLVPIVWESAEGQSLLRIQVMVALQRLVNALGAESSAAYPVLLPVLSVATDPTQPDELNLLEDGLLLWFVALRHAPEPHPGLIAPLPNLLATMERSTEHIAVGGRIIVSCLYLSGHEVVAAHGQRIAAVLANFIGNVKDRGMLCLLPILDLIIELFPGEGPGVLAPALHALLVDIHSGKETAMVIAPALGVLARLLLHNPAAFLQVFHQSSSAIQPQMNSNGASDPAQMLLLATVDLWLDKFDSISSPPMRKLSALALCSLLAAPVPGILHRIGDIAACVTAVWFELEGPDAGPEKLNTDYLAAWLTPRFDELPLAVNVADAEGEDNRRKAVFDASPVATVGLGLHCKQQMEAAAGVHGADAFNQALNSMDPTLGAQLKQMLDSST